jgi:hypothetical protein
MKRPFLFLGLWMALLTSKTFAETVRLPSGWTHTVSKKDWHFETLQNISPKIDGVFRQKTSPELEIFSSYTVERLTEKQDATAYLKEACTVRDGQLLEVGKNTICRVADRFKTTTTWQYFTAWTPEKKRKSRNPFAYVQYWTAPNAADPKASTNIEKLLLAGGLNP